MKQTKPSLLLVGAGPGDPDLITMKGLRAIRSASVILYDALVSPELLKEAPHGCKLVYVGKRRTRKEFSQGEINRLLVFYAERYNQVVRLKGGDPFVFGRGHEEMEYAIKHGVPVDVIPGISSSYAAPSCAGIPLTTRGVNESFWVVTGTVSSGKISEDLNKAAETSATIIVLMGLSHLEEIANLISATRGKNEPIAVIQQATLPTQKVVVGTATTIYQRVMEENITSPAIIVVGKVVDLRLVVQSSPDIFERRMQDEVKFKKAMDAFDQYNSKDRNQEILNGQPEPKELLYAQRMTQRLMLYKPDSSEYLQLAARSQHIGRWEIARSSYPMDKKGYMQWRNKLKDHHACIAEPILKTCGYDELIIEKVKALLLKKNLTTNPDTQTLEDVICLVFLEYYAEEFAAKHPDEKVVDILRKTIKKMSVKAIQSVADLPLSDKIKSMISAAVNS